VKGHLGLTVARGRARIEPCGPRLFTGRENLGGRGHRPAGALHYGQ